jgi:hypothetical protein
MNGKYSSLGQFLLHNEAQTRGYEEIKTHSFILKSSIFDL